jgi:hypothetical protein
LALDVIFKFYTEWAVIPGSAKASINFRRGKYKSTTLGE